MTLRSGGGSMSTRRRLKRRLRIEPLEPRRLLDVSHVSGELLTDTTWSGTVVVDSTVFVGEDVNLTVEAGTIVKFAEDAGLNVMGVLDVGGTAQKPAVFTSIKDDSVGGDTNEDGQSAASPGDWRGLRLRNNGAPSELDHFEVHYASYTWESYAGESAIALYGRAVLQNGLIADSQGIGIVIASGDPTLADVTIRDCGSEAIAGNLTAQPEVSDVTFENNGINALGVTWQKGDLPANLTWDNDVTYYTTGVEIPEGTTLTISGGAVVKVRAGGEIEVSDGSTLKLAGTADDPVIVTSVVDDTVGGDTNNDGDDTAPAYAEAEGMWDGIMVHDGELIADYADVRWAGDRFGSWSYGGSSITVQNGSVTLRNTVIEHGTNAALFLRGAGADSPVVGTVSDCQIRDVVAQTNLGAIRPICSAIYVGQNAALDLQRTTIEDLNSQGQDIDAYAIILEDTPLGALTGSGNEARNCIGAVQLRGEWSGSVPPDPAAGFHISQDDALSPMLGLAYTGDDVVVDEGATLTIGPGTILKDFDLTVNGRLEALGTATSPIIFTNMADDTAGGDTNGDGDATAAPTSTVYNLSVSGDAVLEHVELRYGAGSWDARSALHVRGGEVEFEGGVIADARGYGVYVTTDGATPGEVALRNVDILRPTSDGVVVGAGCTGTLEDVIIDHPGRYGVYAYGSNGPNEIRVLDCQIVSSADDGIHADGSGQNPAQLTVENTDITDAGGRGIELTSDVDGTLTNILISSPGEQGIWAAADSSLFLTNAVIASPGEEGIWAGSGTDLILTNNTIDGATLGVVHDTGDRLELVNNIISNCTTVGIALEHGTSADVVRYNNVCNPKASLGNYINMADYTGIDGNISVSARYVDRKAGDLRLGDGSLCVDAADGDLAPALDQLGLPRFDDRGVDDTGAGTPTYADIGALERWGDSTSQIDLVVVEDSVTGPGAAMVDEMVTINWTITNIGEVPAIGPWHDEISLVRDPDGSATVVVVDEVQVGEGVTLLPGQEHEASAQVRVPAARNGDYYWQVETNSQHDVVEGTNRENNTTRSADTVAVAVPALAMGESVKGTLAVDGDAKYFVVPLAAGEKVALGLNDANDQGINELYARFDELPTRSDYDARHSSNLSADQQIQVSSPWPSMCYIMVYGKEVPDAPGEFTLSASAAGFSISEVSPDSGGDTGDVTVRVTGEGFSDGDAVYLVAPDGETRIWGYPVWIADGSNLYATFDLTNRAGGLYDVVVERPDGTTASKKDAFSVGEGVGPHLSASVVAPSLLRLGQPFSVVVEYANTGDADMASPLLRLTCNEDLSFGLEPNSDEFTGSVEFVGYSSTGPAGVLQPGDREQVTFHALADIMEGAYDFRLEVMTGLGSDADGATEVAWDAYESCFDSFLYEDRTEWDGIWQTFTFEMGQTWGDVVENLAEKVTAEGVAPGALPLLSDLMGEVFSDAVSSGGGLLDSRCPLVLTRYGVLSAEGALEGVDVIFSETIDGDTFTAKDVTLTNPDSSAITDITVERWSDRLYRISFPEQTAAGTYTLQIGSNIADTVGLELDHDHSGTGGEGTDDAYLTVLEFEGVKESPGKSSTGTTRGGLWPSSLSVLAQSVSGTYDRLPGLGSFWVDFNKPVNPSSFTSGDVQILEKLNPLGDPYFIVRRITATEYIVTVRDPTHGGSNSFGTPGNYQLEIGPDISSEGVSLDEPDFDQDPWPVNPGQQSYKSGFEIIDETGPRVIDMSVVDGLGCGFAHPPVSAVDITFSEPITSFPNSQVSVRYRVDGEWHYVAIVGTPSDPNPECLNPADPLRREPLEDENTVWRVTFYEPLTEEAECEVSVGPDITDYYGYRDQPGLSGPRKNKMDQNENGTDGEAADRYTGTFEIIQPYGEVEGRVQYSGYLAGLFGSDMHASVQLWEKDGSVIDIGTHGDPLEQDDFISDWNELTNGWGMMTADLEAQEGRRGILTPDGRFKFTRTHDGELIDFRDIDDDETGVPADEKNIPEFYVVVIAKNEYSYIIDESAIQSTDPDSPIYMPVGLEWGRLIFDLDESKVLQPETKDDEDIDFGTITVDDHLSAFGIAEWISYGAEWLHSELELGDDERVREPIPVSYGLWEDKTGWSFYEEDLAYQRVRDYIRADLNATDPFQILRAYGHSIYRLKAGYCPVNPLDPWGILLISLSEDTAVYEAWANLFAGLALENQTGATAYMTQTSLNRAAGQYWENNNFWMASDAYTIEHADYNPELAYDNRIVASGLAGDFVAQGALNHFENTGEKVCGARQSIYWDIADEANDDEVNNGLRSIYENLGKAYPLDNAVRAIYIDHGIPITDDKHESITLGEDLDGPLPGEKGWETLNGPKKYSHIMAETKDGYGDWHGYMLRTKGSGEEDEEDVKLTVTLTFDPQYGDLDLWVRAIDQLGAGEMFNEKNLMRGPGTVSFDLSLPPGGPLLGKEYWIFVGVGGHGAFHTSYGYRIWVGDMHPYYELSISKTMPSTDDMEEEDGDDYVFPPPWVIIGTVPVPVFWGFDPNEKVGPAGAGDGGYIAPGGLMPYTVYFENDPEKANAPVQKVVITDQLDADLDWGTFAFDRICFGERIIDVPDGVLHFETDTTVPYDEYPVHVMADFDSKTGVITYEMWSYDPETGELPTYPLAGFLPPNDEDGRGEGWVTFTIDPKAGLKTGDEIRNKASIVFDVNDPIITNQTLNTIDGSAPASSVRALSATTTKANFVVKWSGQDDAKGSGIAAYDIYVSTDGGSYQRWLTGTTKTQATFSGQDGHTYGFYSVATDAVGNSEAAPKAADASTRVDTSAPTVLDAIVAGGLTQRSDVRTVELVFSEDVDIEVADVTLMRYGLDASTGAGTPVTLKAANFQYDPQQRTATITFDTPLADGYYVLEVKGNGVTDLVGKKLDGDGDGTAGGDYVYGFHRLAGDLNGDGAVNVLDCGQLQAAMVGGYAAEADVDGDGKLDGSDATALMTGLGAYIIPPANGQAASKPIGLAARARSVGEQARVGSVGWSFGDTIRVDDGAEMEMPVLAANVASDLPGDRLKWLGLEDAVRHLEEQDRASAWDGDLIARPSDATVDAETRPAVGAVEPQPMSRKPEEDAVLSSPAQMSMSDPSATSWAAPLGNWAAALLPESAGAMLGGLDDQVADRSDPRVDLLFV